jgi:hypothetical protein
VPDDDERSDDYWLGRYDACNIILTSPRLNKPQREVVKRVGFKALDQLVARGFKVENSPEYEAWGGRPGGCPVTAWQTVGIIGLSCGFLVLLFMLASKGHELLDNRRVRAAHEPEPKREPIDEAHRKWLQEPIQTATAMEQWYAASMGIELEAPKARFFALQCQWCKGVHTSRCPALKEASYYESGATKKVVLYDEGDYEDAGVIYFEDVFDPELSAEADGTEGEPSSHR